MAQRMSPAARRYLWRFLPAMAVYSAAVLGVSAWLGGSAPPRGLLLYAAAVAPAVPLLAAIWAIGRFLVELEDEYQRALLIEAVLWATGLTLAITTVWGFLQVYADAPAPPLFFVFILFCAALGVAQIARQIRERLR